MRPPRLTSSASVWLISTFLDEVPADVALSWRHAGHSVRVVDCLPKGLHASDPSLQLALRLELTERAARLRRLVDAGVDVLPWPWLDGPDRAALLTMSRRRR